MPEFPLTKKMKLRPGMCAAVINVDRNLEIEDLAGKLDLSSARRVVYDLENALEKLERNVNPRLLLEVLLLDLPKA